MKATRMTFGIEIECLVPIRLINNHTLVPGGHGDGNEVDCLPEGWKVERDGSVGTSRAGYTGVEFVSPILCGVDGFRQIKTVCKQLKEWQASINPSCGFHVHIGFNARKIATLRRLVHLVAVHEKALFAATGTHSRESNYYCKPIKTAYRGLSYRSLRRTLGGDRYYILNLQNLITGRKPTVEFRVFAGTTNYKKMVGYVRMCLALVQAATERKELVEWDTPLPTWPGYEGKVGGAALWQFISDMNWNEDPGDNMSGDRVFGEVVADDIPSLADSIRTLEGMAAKYDAGEEGDDIEPAIHRSDAVAASTGPDTADTAAMFAAHGDAGRDAGEGMYLVHGLSYPAWCNYYGFRENSENHLAYERALAVHRRVTSGA